LARWNRRERGLIEDNKGSVPAVAFPPEPIGAYVGAKESLTGDIEAAVFNEGARTIPPREHGGNVDIKNLSRGSKVFFPVYVKGAKLSMGDLHFSQVCLL
jgi:formamidase